MTAPHCVRAAPDRCRTASSVARRGGRDQPSPTSTADVGTARRFDHRTAGRRTCASGRGVDDDDGRTRGAGAACDRPTASGPERPPASAACRTARSTTPPPSPCASTTLPAIPTLPRRSPAEGMIAQAVVGIAGVTLGQYGSIAVDVDAARSGRAGAHRSRQRRLRRAAHVPRHRRRPRPAAGRSSGSSSGRSRSAWRSTRVGVPADTGVRRRRRAPCAPTSRRSPPPSPTALPESPQLVWLDEPWFGELMHPGFPIAPDPAIDLLSGAMAVLEPVATVGVHCCADVDIASLLAAGPSVLSVPVDEQLVDVAGYLVRFLERGGRIAWGVVPTDGPIATTSERSWRQLSDLWCELVRRGCDPGAPAPAQPGHAAVRPRAAHAVGRRPRRAAHPRGRPARQRAGRRQPLRPRRVASGDDRRRATRASAARRTAVERSPADDRSTDAPPRRAQRARRLPQPALPRARRPGDLRRRLRPARPRAAPAGGRAPRAGRRRLRRPGGRRRAERAVRAGRALRADDEPRQRDDAATSCRRGASASPAGCPTRPCASCAS